MPNTKVKKPRANLRLEVGKLQRIELVDTGMMVNGWIRSIVPSISTYDDTKIEVEIVFNEVIWSKDAKNA